MNLKSFTIFRTLLTLTTLTVATSLMAADINWTGAGGNTSWHDPANWDTGTVPTNADVVFLDDDDYVVITEAAEAFNLRMNNGATLSIFPMGQLSFSSSTKSMADIIIMEDGTSLLNSGMISITADTEGNNIDANGSSFINNNGSMTLSQSDEESIFLYEGAYLDNSGQLTILDSNEDGVDMEDIAAIYSNGTITVKNTLIEGLDMDDGSEFINDGTLRFENIDDNDAIDMDDSGSYFENNGNLEIVGVTNRGEGIEVDDGFFINTETGSITLTGVTGDGIYVQDDGEFINLGYLSVSTASGESSDNSIELECDGFFYNEGLLEITNNGATDAIELECSSSLFVNESCGEIYILSNSKIDIQSTGEFINEGILSTAFTGTNTNFGTFDNAGIINSPNGFMISPNPVNEVDNYPGGWSNFTVGNSGTLGNDFAYIACDGEETFYVTGGGNNATSSTTDNVAFTNQYLCGNVSITAKIESVDPNGYGGLMIREPEADGSRQVSIFSNLTNVLRHEARYVENTPKQVQAHYRPNPFWLRLERQGNWIFAYYSTTGANFQYIHAVNVPMDNCVEIGLASFTFQPDQQTTAVFTNVEVTGGMIPYATPPVETEAIQVKQQISVYPNPASDFTNLAFEGGLDQDATVLLRNQLGQVVDQRLLREGDYQAEWNVSNQAAGMYLFEIHREGQDLQVQRFVKTK